MAVLATLQPRGELLVLEWHDMCLEFLRPLDLIDLPPTNTRELHQIQRT